MKILLLTVLAVALLGAGLFETISLRRHNDLRRMQVTELRRLRDRQQQEAARATPVEVPVAPREPPPADVSAPSSEVAKIRAEIAALEQRATEEHALRPEATDAPSTNRDPEKAMTRLEYFQNVGQATPAAAFQTLVWAALKGDEKTMAQAIGLDDGARRKVLELMGASLSAAEREKYPTPESILTLFLAKALIRVSSLQIVETEPKDALNATVTVRGLMGNDQKLPMRLGPTGWQLLEGEKNVEWLREEFRAPAKK